MKKIIIVSLCLSTNILTNAQEKNADTLRNDDMPSVKVISSNNKLPYAPEWLINSSLNVEFQNGLGLKLYAHYVSSQFTDELNTILPSYNGLSGKLDSRIVLDISAYFTPINKHYSFQFAIKNVNNERYIASRRPQGIRVGIPIMISCGVDFKL